jgi:hypothetical protein
VEQELLTLPEHLESPPVFSGARVSKEEYEDTKGVIRIHISKKKRQHNGKRKKDKRAINDPQNIHIKLKIE